MAETTRLIVEIEKQPSPLIRTFTGRDAWTLAQLVAAGPRGVTPIDYPAPRWSHYVLRLRKSGLEIETIRMPNTGAFRGTHGRYLLRSNVRVLAPDEAA